MPSGQPVAWGTACLHTVGQPYPPPTPRPPLPAPAAPLQAPPLAAAFQPSAHRLISHITPGYLQGGPAKRGTPIQTTTTHHHTPSDGLKQTSGTRKASRENPGHLHGAGGNATWCSYSGQFGSFLKIQTRNTRTSEQSHSRALVPESEDLCSHEHLCINVPSSLTHNGQSPAVLQQVNGCSICGAIPLGSEKEPPLIHTTT